jgi:Zn-dependent protease with chaperone function
LAWMFPGDRRMIAADYFDGRSARPFPALLDVRAGALLVSTAVAEHSYPLSAVTLPEPFAAASVMLRFADGASCEVSAGAARDALLAALGYRPGGVERWQARWPAALVALLLLVALLAFLYFRGVPAAAGYIASKLPPSVDTMLGKAALAALEQQDLLAPSRLSDERIAEVESLLPPLLPPRPRVPVRLVVRNSNKLGANALALPDGTIVVTDRMVRLVQTEGNDLDSIGRQQLSAVLAHEVGHLELRHGARTMAGSSLAAALSAAVFGDFSAVAAGVPAMLSQMQYSRGMEDDADAYAVRVLHRNGIPVDAFVDVLAGLDGQQDDESDLPRWMRQSMSYLSTHPKTSGRIARLRRLE